MFKQRVRFLKNVLIMYICIGLFSASVQYHYLEKSYNTIERSILFELNVKHVEDVSLLTSFVKKTIATQTEYLNFIFFISFWQILLMLTILFVCHLCLSLRKVLGVVNE